MSIQHSKLVLKRVSPAVWDVCLQLLLIFFIKSSPVQIKSCKSSELISIWRYPISLNLWLQSNRGWNRDYRTKLGFKERVTIRRTLWMVSERKVLNFGIITREIEMSLDSWSVRNCKVGFCWETARGNAVRKKDDTWIISLLLSTYKGLPMKYVCIQSLHACGGSLSGVRSDGFCLPV